jgi:hypothetical protein
MLEHPTMLRGTVDRVRFRGASLEDNELGDPVERELIVYLPPSYAGSALRYPVVFVLPGFAATNGSLLNFKPWEPNLLERYEGLLAAGCGEAILVLPDCFTRLGGSQYLDSPATGRYQSYLADDVLSLVDARYRTIARREGRAIVGKSSGGFGALRMGMDRPERFSVIGSHAGDCAFELCIRPRFVEVAPVYERHGGADAFLQALRHRGPASQREFHAIEILALAHAYAPSVEASAAASEQRVQASAAASEQRVQASAATSEQRVQASAAASEQSSKGCRGELPFDPRTALLIPEKWARWLAHDPVVRADTSPQGLADARLVFLDAGKSDEYGLQFGARLLAERLVRSGVVVDHEEFEGGHMGTAYRYDVSLPKIIAALESPLASGDAREHRDPSHAPASRAHPSSSTAASSARGDTPPAESIPLRAMGARVTREPL